MIVQTSGVSVFKRLPSIIVLWLSVLFDPAGTAFVASGITPPPAPADTAKPTTSPTTIAAKRFELPIPIMISPLGSEPLRAVDPFRQACQTPRGLRYRFFGLAEREPHLMP